MLTTAPLGQDELDQTWEAYKLDRSERARHELILHYRSLVVKIAASIGQRLPQHVDKEDLISYGYIGLMDAIEKFDPSLGFKFKTYAGLRINGQIVDELRKLDWVPRSVHSQTRDWREAYAALETRLQRVPTDAELAASMGISEKALADSRSEASLVKVLALDAIVETDAELAPTLISQLHDRSESPDGEFQIESIKTTVAAAMSVLPQRESIVLALYYVESLTLSDIGRLLGVTESRVCQMHTRAMTQVRNKLAAA